MQRLAVPLACGAWRAACGTAAARRPSLPACSAAVVLARGRARSRPLHQLHALGSAFLNAPPPPPVAGPRADFVLVDANPLLYAAHFAFEGASVRHVHEPRR